MTRMPVSRHLVTRLLGVGLAGGIAAVTIALALQGRLGLYINPDSSWFAVSMAVVALVGAVASFALPLGAESDHGHAHDHDHGHDHAGFRAGAVATVTGGVVATGIVGMMVLVPPATLSADMAIARDTGTPPLFQGADAVQLAVTGDTASFGVGEWASVFATATNPEAFDGDAIELTGFVTPADDGVTGFDLSRLVITHCVIDAQSANIPVAADDLPETGQWVTVTGTIRDVDGKLQIQPATVELIDEPADPYEY